MTAAPPTALGAASAAAPGAVPVPAAAQVRGVDVLSRTLQEADAAAHRLVAALREAGPQALHGCVVASHLTRLGPLPHVTLSVSAPGVPPEELAALVARALPDAVTCGTTGAPDPVTAAAAAGAQAHAAGTGGRAVHYPGVELLVGTLPVAEVLAVSAVDAVRVLSGGGEPDPDVLLVTRGHVRPALEDGRLVLTAERAAGGRLVPFEVPNPTPCCADHP